MTYLDAGPTLGDGMLKFKLVLAKDAVRVDGSFPRTLPYTEECQYPEALDPIVVSGSLVICTFSEGFFNQTSNVSAIFSTAKTLGFMGFVLVANPAYGDFVSEPIPFPVPGIMIPKTADTKVSNLRKDVMIVQFHNSPTPPPKKREQQKMIALKSIHLT